MIDPATATITAAVIAFSGKVLCAVITKRVPAISPAPGRSSPSPVTIVATINNADYEEIIDQAEKHFRGLSSLIRSVRDSIIDELVEQSIAEAVEELQASVNVLKRVMDYRAMDIKLKTELVTALLTPLELTMETAIIKLRRLERDDLSRLCHIAGSSALLGAYAFLGLDMEAMRRELAAESKVVQTELLDALALEIIPRRDGSFPWDKVGMFLSPQGAEELSRLYIETTRDALPPTTEAAIDPATNITHLSVKDAQVLIRETTDKSLLTKWRRQEMNSRGRDRVIKAIERQRARL